MAIRSFGDKRTEQLFNGERVKALPPEIARAVERRLDLLNAARAVSDLRQPPGNRLEALQGDRFGQFSIRVNDQWRIVFRWHDQVSEDITLVDYHK